MADTTLILNSNRFSSESYLFASVSGVALDASVFETFRLPVGFGQLLCKWAMVQLSTFSGAYVAPAPAEAGTELAVVSQDLSTRVDGIGVGKFIVRQTTSARSDLAVSFDLQNRVLIRQLDRLAIFMPILAGAGVTGGVSLALRGVRIQTA